MENLGRILRNTSAGIMVSAFMTLPGFAQETKNSNKYLKLGVSPIFWSNNYLSKYYKNTTLVHGGCEYPLLGGLNLGWNVMIGSKKETDSKKPHKINYFSTNLEASLGATRDKNVSLYALIGLGIVSLEEKNNSGSRKTKTTSFGGYFGPGLNIKLGKNAYLFAEIKENLGKIISYKKLLGINGPMITTGIKIPL